MLQRKLDAQEAELAMVEREVAEMTAELKQAMLGVPGATFDLTMPRHGRGGAVLDDRRGWRVSSMPWARARARSEREAAAEERLAELKRRMGK